VPETQKVTRVEVRHLERPSAAYRTLGDFSYSALCLYDCSCTRVYTIAGLLMALLPFPRVQAVMRLLGLRGCGDTLVGGEEVKGISGGEKRRLSLAVQMLLDPSVLLL
jgi:hypothetical protein